MRKTSKTSHTELSMDYEDAFELTGHGQFNHLVLMACSLIFMHALVEMQAMAYVTNPARCDLDLSINEKSLIGSAIFIGIVMSAICWGSICDRYGRRRVMLPALIGAVAASFASSMCTVFWTMFVLRIITGILVSASSATVLVYLGELHTTSHRDVAMSWAVSAVAVVFVIIPGVAWMIIPGKWSMHIGDFEIKPWRVFMWLWGVIGLSGAIMLFFLPESPRYILASQGPFKAMPILGKMYAWNHRKEHTLYPVTSVRTSSVILRSGDSGFGSTLRDMSQLLRPPMLRCFLISHYCMFIVYLLATGIYLWMPNIYNLSLRSLTAPYTVCDVVKSDASKAAEWFAGGEDMDCSSNSINTMMYPISMGMEIIFLIPFVIVTIIIDKVNKRLLYACVIIPCSVFLALSVLIPNVITANIFITIGLCSGSCASILSALAVDAFPTSIRALAMCTMYMMGQVGAVVGNTIVSVAVAGPCTLIFLITAACVAASAVFLGFLWPKLSIVRRHMESRGFTY